jgi:hypothetical protein
MEAVGMLDRGWDRRLSQVQRGVKQGWTGDDNSPPEEGSEGIKMEWRWKVGHT